MVDDNASFFMMSYPLTARQSFWARRQNPRENNALNVNNIYKLDVKMYIQNAGFDYMKSKLYLVWKAP